MWGLHHRLIRPPCRPFTSPTTGYKWLERWRFVERRAGALSLGRDRARGIRDKRANLASTFDETRVVRGPLVSCSQDTFLFRQDCF